MPPKSSTLPCTVAELLCRGYLFLISSAAFSDARLLGIQTSGQTGAVGRKKEMLPWFDLKTTKVAANENPDIL